MKRKLLSLFSALCLLVTLMPTAWATGTNTVSGNCGEPSGVYGEATDAITWSFDQSTGALRLNGTGGTKYYAYMDDNMDIEIYGLAPWQEWADQIKYIYVGEGITSLNRCLFQSCTAALSIELPASLTHIEASALPRGNTLKTIEVVSGNSKYETVSGVLFSKYGNDSNATTGYWLLKYPAGKTDSIYYIPEKVEHIQQGAFSGCENLKKVILNDQMTCVDDGAFYNCTSLEEIDIPYGVTKIGYAAFKMCTSLSTIKLPLSVTSLATSAFWDCKALSSIEIPSSVTEILNSETVSHDSSKSKQYYFYGNAPQMQYGFSSYEDYQQIRTDIYYPANASGWGELQQQDLIKYQIEEGSLTFNTWNPPDETLVFSIARSAVTVKEGETATPRVSLAPSGATMQWTSSHPAIATVSNSGVITGIKAGTALITGTAQYGNQTKTVTCAVMVSTNVKVKFKDAVVYLENGQSANLVYTKSPSTAAVTLTSSNASVASVSGSKVTGVGAGTATITATITANGVTETDTCTVTVAASANEKAQDFVNTALAQVGKKGSDFGFPSGVNWCSKFVEWCARESNVTAAIPSGASPYLEVIKTVGGTGVFFDDIPAIRELQNGSKYKKYFSNAQVVNRDSYKPQIGDLVIIRNNDITSTNYLLDHIGIVYDVDATHVYVVHGNWSKKCTTTTWGYREYSYKDRISGKKMTSYIIGYAHPDWSAISGVKSGTKRYQVNCPVDVSVTYDNEVLDSATGQATSAFGTMSADDGITVDFSNYYDTATIINGTGDGTMDFIATFTDEDSTVSTRTFKGVPIAEDTIVKVIDPNQTASSVILEVYSNYGETLTAVWCADSEEEVTGPDADLLEWYLNVDADEQDPNESSPGSGSGSGSDSGSGSGSTPTYTISVPSKVDNGTVTVNPQSASKNDTVTITVKADEGYALDTLTVTDASGKTIKLTDKGNGKYTFTMPAGKVTVDATFSKIAESHICDPYDDVNTSAWYHDAVDYVLENGIMNGMGGGKFSPSANLSRAMLMTMLARLDGVNTDGGAVWYEKGMSWAVANGVSDGTNPTANISREQVATMLYRYAQLKGYDTTKMASLNSFADGANTSAWAVDAMQWAVANGVMQGSNNRLNPQGSATRAEVAQLFMNFCENMTK